MSKFFAGGASDSSDYSSSEEEDLWLSEQSDVSESLGESSSNESEDSGGEEEEESPQQQVRRNKFLKGAGSDSDESDSDDDRGAIKSAKDKLIDEVNASVRSFETSASEDSWVDAAASFDKAFKTQERAMRVYSVVPLSIVKLLTTIDTQLADARAKKLTPSSAKAVNAINQRTKKVSKEYADRIEKYRADPDNYNPEPPTVSELERESGGASGASRDQDGEYSSATLFTTLATIVQGRGKKKTDKGEQVQILERLLEVAETAYQKLSVLLILAPIRFDLHASGQMPKDTWKAIENDIRKILEVLEANPDYIVIETAKEPEEIDTPPAPGPGGARQIPGSVSSLVERLDDEHLKALQVIDPHTSEYVERLQHQTQIYDLFLRVQAHMERNLERIGKDENDSGALHRLLARRLDHIYYKPSEAIIATELTSWKAVPESLSSRITPRLTAAPQNAAEYTIELIDSICKALYNQPNTVFRSKAMLALIYHYALNDMYHKARDLMLMSHLQSTIQNAEPTVQVMFNRALVQVGLCAFRCGLIHDALQALQEVCSSSRLKELLGQGLAKFATGSTPDRSQILPFHMHINIELIECVYLTCSLLIEIPQSAGLAAGGAGGAAGATGSASSAASSTGIGAAANTRSADKKKTASKPLRRMLDFYDRQVLIGPSENTRDHIIQAAKALQQGDWQEASSLLCSIKVWSLLSKKTETEKIMAMLKEKLQTEGLVTYLLNFCSCYDSLSLEYLTEQFQLSLEAVRSIIQKMIVNDELAAAFDESDKYLVFGKSADASKLQVLAAALADKTALLSERNERLAGDGHDAKKNSSRFPRKVAA